MSKNTPFDDELEKAVLGELMLDKNAFDTTMGLLTPESFYNDAHVTIFRTMLTMHNSNKPCGLMSVTAELKSRNMLDQVGGAYYVTTLTNAPSNYQLEHHTLVLAQLYVRRQLINVSADISYQAYEGFRDPLEQLDNAEKQLQTIRSTIESARRTADFPTQLRTEVNEKKEAVLKGIGFNGISTGSEKLNKAIGGLQKSDLILLAGRPGAGKTSRALMLAKQVALQGEPVAVFSLEMSANQLVRKFIIEQSNIYGNKYIENRLTPYDLENIEKASVELMKLPIEIYDNGAITPLHLKSRLRRFIKKFGKVSAVVIDYIQLMKSHERCTSPEQEISSVSRTLKEIAKEFDVPVLALAQLSRDVEKRGGTKRPQMSDLRGSGSLEQDADLVLLLYRPSYYFPYGKHPDEAYDESKVGKDEYNMVCELIIEKFRGGKPDRTIIEYFDAPLSRFSDEYKASEEAQGTIFEGDELPF